MKDKRRCERQKTLLGARIAWSSLSTMDCVVHNLSAGGARLQFGDATHVPREIVVMIPRRDIRQIAHVIWRSPVALGIAFETAA